MKKIKILLFASLLMGLTACGEWLNVVPDGIATLDMAFNSRAQARKYLATCYYYQPRNGGSDDPATLGGDDIWTRRTSHFSTRFNLQGLDISDGMQNATSPVMPRWGHLYNGLRACNTFLENIGSVPDLEAWEREQWAAEITVLKAYYHFALVQMYGPIPIIRENLPVDADVYAVKVDRRPVDEVVDYIVELLDEATTGDQLPTYILDPASDYGRITKPIALSLKAKVLVYAASPLFNGNNDQATLKNHDGTYLFNSEYQVEKWEKAVAACKEAIDICHDAGFELYKFDNPGNRYGDTCALNVTLRNAFTLKYNSEIIWANTRMYSIGSSGGMIHASMPKLNANYQNSGEICKWFGLPIKIAEMFYGEHGVPLDEDKDRNVGDLFNIRKAVKKDALYVKEDKVTIDLHFDREPRFYAWVGFDRGIWFGAGQYDDKDPNSLRWLGFRVGEVDGTEGQGLWTGYIPKKYVPYEAMLNEINSISSPNYPWPIMRLSDLYLLYAEAINEAEGPNGANSAEMYRYINLVRERAGLEGVKESWDKYTTNTKYTNQAGMREIIQKERLIELCFEGQRFWDIRRWKTAPREYSTPLKGWDMLVAVSDGTEEQTAQMMYQPQLLIEQKFGIRDYFWPIRTYDIEINPNLVQNIGW
jgi:hypothetical protein